MRRLMLPLAASLLTLGLAACNSPEEAYTPVDETAPAAGTGTTGTDPMMPPPTDPMAPPTDPMNPMDPNAPTDPMMPPVDETQMPPTSPETPPAMDSTSTGT